MPQKETREEFSTDVELSEYFNTDSNVVEIGRMKIKTEHQFVEHLLSIDLQR